MKDATKHVLHPAVCFRHVFMPFTMFLFGHTIGTPNSVREYFHVHRCICTQCRYYSLNILIGPLVPLAVS